MIYLWLTGYCHYWHERAFSGAESVPEWWDKLLAGEEFTQPTCTEDDNGNPD